MRLAQHLAVGFAFLPGGSGLLRINGLLGRLVEDAYVQQFRVLAAVKVNDEMLRFYWSVGEDIEKRQYENRYGSHFYENVSKDLRKALDLTRGMSESTIRYTHYFYCLYSQLIGNRQQDAEDLRNSLPTPEEIEDGLREM